jgi:hypothetical protein
MAQLGDNKQAKKPASKMHLGAVTRGVLEQPHRICVYGPEGVGKTTFAATAPEPIFVGAEDGSGALDVARFPRPESWADILDAVDALTAGGHAYRTLVLDSLDWAEPLLWAHVCARAGKASIEDFGFGKGYVEALSESRVLLGAIERMQRETGMHVVVIAHAQLRKFANPSGEDWDRWTTKTNEKLGGAVREWCDCVLFAHFEQFSTSIDGRAKGVSTGRRVMATTKTAAWDAKNRYALPDELELSWLAFAKSIERNRKAAAEIRAAIASEPEKLAKFDAWSAKAPPIHELVAMRDRLISEKAISQ